MTMQIWFAGAIHFDQAPAVCQRHPIQAKRALVSAHRCIARANRNQGLARLVEQEHVDLLDAERRGKQISGLR